MAWKKIQFFVQNDEIDSTLSNFPVTVRLNSNSGTNGINVTRFFDDIAYADRLKVAFFNATMTTQYYFKCETFDETLEEATYVFKPSSLSNTSSTEFILAYDPNAADNTSYGGDSGDVVVANVYSNYDHAIDMAQDPSAGDELDSVGSLDFTPTNFSAADSVDGIIGKAISFDGSGTQDLEGVGIAFGNDDFVWQIWAKTTYASNAGEIYHHFNQATWNNALEVYYSAIGGNGYFSFSAYGPDDGVNGETGTINDGEWHLITFMRSGNDWYIYNDYTLADSDSGNTGTLDEASQIEKFSPFGTNIEAEFDDLRIKLGGTVSVDWLKAQYNDGIDNLIEWGWLEEPNWRHKIKVVVEPTNIDENLTNFPLPLEFGVNVGTGDTKDLTHIFTHLGTNYKKVALFDSDFDQQYFLEAENYDNSSQKANYNSVVNLSSTSRNVFWFCYDNSRDDNTNFVGDPGSAVAKNVYNSVYDWVWTLSQDLNSSDAIDSCSDVDLSPSGWSTTSVVDGTIGNAAQFIDADNTYARAGANTVRIGSGDFTITGWFNVDSGGTGSRIMGFETGASTESWRVFVVSNELRCSADDPLDSLNMACSAVDYSNDNWHFVAFTRSGNSWSLRGDYSDQDTDITVLTAIDDATANFDIGDNVSPIDGIIDDVRIVAGEALSDAWIKAQYYAGSQQLVGYDVAHSDVLITLYNVAQEIADGKITLYNFGYRYNDHTILLTNGAINHTDRTISLHSRKYMERRLALYNKGQSYNDKTLVLYPSEYVDRSVVLHNRSSYPVHKAALEPKVRVMLDDIATGTSSDVTDEINSFSISNSKGSICNTIDLEIDNDVYFNLFATRQLIDEPILEVFLSLDKHPTYPGDYTSQGKFFLEDQGFGDSPQGITCGLSGRNKAAKVLDPYSPLITKTWENETTAYAIASGEVAKAGLSLTWDIDDYKIKANTLTVENVTIGELVQQLAELTNGYTRCTKDGNIWVKKHKKDLGERDDTYPVDFGYHEKFMAQLSESVTHPNNINYVEILGAGTDSPNLEIIVEPQELEADGISVAEVIVIATDDDGNAIADGTDIHMTIDDIGLAVAGSFVKTPLTVGKQTIVDEPAILQKYQLIVDEDFTTYTSLSGLTFLGDPVKFQLLPPGYKAGNDIIPGTNVKKDIGAVVMAGGTRYYYGNEPDGDVFAKGGNISVLNNVERLREGSAYPDLLDQTVLDAWPVPYIEVGKIFRHLVFSNFDNGGPVIIENDVDYTEFACSIVRGTTIKVADGVTVTFGAVNFMSIPYYDINFVPLNDGDHFTVKFTDPVITPNIYPRNWDKWKSVIQFTNFISCDVIIENATVKANQINRCRFFDNIYVKANYTSEFTHCDFIRSNSSETTGLLWSNLDNATEYIWVKNCNFYAMSGYAWKDTSTAGTAVKTNNVYYGYTTGIFNNTGSISLVFDQNNEIRRKFPWCVNYYRDCDQYYTDTSLKVEAQAEATYSRAIKTFTALDSDDSFRFEFDIVIVDVNSTDANYPDAILGVFDSTVTTFNKSNLGVFVYRGSSARTVKFGVQYCETPTPAANRQTSTNEYEYELWRDRLNKFRLVLTYHNNYITLDVYKISENTPYLLDTSSVYHVLVDGAFSTIAENNFNFYKPKPEWLTRLEYDASGDGSITQLNGIGISNVDYNQSIDPALISIERIKLNKGLFKIRVDSTDIDTIYGIYKDQVSNRVLTYDVYNHHLGEHDFSTSATISNNLITINDSTIYDYEDETVFLVTYDRKINKIIGEIQTSTDKYTVMVNWPIANIDIAASIPEGVFTTSTFSGINYYGDQGSYSGKLITLGIPLPNPVQKVYIVYRRGGVAIGQLISGEATGNSIVRGETE